MIVERRIAAQRVRAECAPTQARRAEHVLDAFETLAGARGRETGIEPGRADATVALAQLLRERGETDAALALLDIVAG